MSEVISIGVTGSRHGANEVQLATLRQIIVEITHREWNSSTRLVLHHGDCHGVDAQVAGMVAALSWELHVHPPDNDRYRAYVPAHVAEEPLPYLTRDRNIVTACSLLIAAPNRTFDVYASYERGDGGTAYTVKHAMTRGRPTWIVWPTGGIEKVNEPHA